MEGVAVQVIPNQAILGGKSSPTGAVKDLHAGFGAQVRGDRELILRPADVAAGPQAACQRRHDRRQIAERNRPIEFYRGQRDAAVRRHRDVAAVEVVEGAHLVEPGCQPSALESRMPGDQDRPVLPELRVRLYQTFHGASPESHKDRKRFLSRTVSIGCQKPSCL